MNESSLRGHDATLLKQQQKQWGVNKGWDRLIWYVVFFRTYIYLFSSVPEPIGTNIVPYFGRGD